MNPVVLVHFLAAVLVIAASVPLVRRKVRMNPWYGVRIPAAFASESAWFEINEHGGRLLLKWGVMLAVMAAAGAFVERKYWIDYNCVALVLIAGGLAVVIVKVIRYANRR